MSAIVRWGESHFKPMAMLAQRVALSTESFHEVVEELREQWLRATPEARKLSLDQWIACYDKPLEVESVLLQFLDAASEVERLPEVRQRGPQLRRALKRDLEAAATQVMLGKSTLTKREIAWANRSMKDVYAAHLRDIEQELAGECEPPQNFREWLGQPEFVFFFGMLYFANPSSRGPANPAAD